MARLYICEGCKRLTEPAGSYCEECAVDIRSIRRIYEKLVRADSALLTLTPARVFLQLATEHIKRKRK